MSTVDTKHGGLFFVDGPGGTGKTYMYKALLDTIRSQKKIDVATATSSVAASIMPGDRTAHSRFKIPLTIDDGLFAASRNRVVPPNYFRPRPLLFWTR
jgi:Rad3-related DNA helicase